MKLVRKNIKFLSLFMLTLIMFLSCTRDNIHPEKYDAVDFTGKELFKGIYFASGAVAKATPSIRNSYSYYELSKTDATKKQNFELRMNEILSEIEKQNPDYFEEFKREIQTKNQLIIESALKEGSQLLFETAIRLYLTNEQESQMNSMISKINIEDFKNDDGSMDFENLKDELEKNKDFEISDEIQGVFAGIVFVAAAYVLVVHAAAALSYVAVAWVGEYFAAIDQETAITREETAITLNSEVLINDLSLLNIR